ncbi:MAG: GNAT family N-acetyltransferase [Acidobacteriota bacterium]|nr:GNAT family N-acetyltransferase [Acidobacteriota bacterium]
MARRHRDHDAVAEAIRARYRTPEPSLGYGITPRPYGVLATLGNVRRAILAEDVSARNLSPLVDDVTEVWVDDRHRAERLAPTLASWGYAPGRATTYLALVGEVRAIAPEGLVLRPARDALDFARRKLTYFADGVAPSEDDLAREVATRERERDLADFYVVDVAGDVAGILAAYRGADVTTYLLATEPRQRSRGVGSGALATWVASTSARSHVINALDGGPAAGLYRRLGFSDEVYWYQRFERA